MKERTSENRQMWWDVYLGGTRGDRGREVCDVPIVFVTANFQRLLECAIKSGVPGTHLCKSRLTTGA
jgi:hypothetical protein